MKAVDNGGLGRIAYLRQHETCYFERGMLIRFARIHPTGPAERVPEEAHTEIIEKILEMPKVTWQCVLGDLSW